MDFAFSWERGPHDSESGESVKLETGKLLIDSSLVISHNLLLPPGIVSGEEIAVLRRVPTALHQRREWQDATAYETEAE
jgi:hypothetical protein